MDNSNNGKVAQSYLEINKENFASFGNLDSQMFNQLDHDSTLKTDSRYDPQDFTPTNQQSQQRHLMYHQTSSSHSIGRHASDYNRSINIQTHTTDRSCGPCGPNQVVKDGKVLTIATYRHNLNDPSTKSSKKFIQQPPKPVRLSRSRSISQKARPKFQSQIKDIMKGNRNQQLGGTKKLNQSSNSYGDQTTQKDCDITTQKDFTLEFSQELLTEESRQESIKKEMIEKEHDTLRQYIAAKDKDNARNYINQVYEDIESQRFNLLEDSSHTYDLPRQIHSIHQKSESSKSPEPRQFAPSSMMSSPKRYQNSTRVANSKMSSLKQRPMSAQGQMSVQVPPSRIKPQLKPRIPKFQKTTSKSRSRSRSKSKPKSVKLSQPKMSFQKPKASIEIRRPSLKKPKTSIKKPSVSRVIESYPNNCDITPILSPTKEDDDEANFVKFLKNVQLYLQSEQSPKKPNGDHFYKNLQFLREKYKKYKNGFSFEQFKQEFIQNMEACDNNTIELRSNDYPMLMTNEYHSDFGSSYAKSPTRPKKRISPLRKNISPVRKNISPRVPLTELQQKQISYIDEIYRKVVLKTEERNQKKQTEKILQQKAKNVIKSIKCQTNDKSMTDTNKQYSYQERQPLYQEREEFSYQGREEFSYQGREELSYQEREEPYEPNGHFSGYFPKPQSTLEHRGQSMNSDLELEIKSKHELKQIYDQIQHERNKSQERRFQMQQQTQQFEEMNSLSSNLQTRDNLGGTQETNMIINAPNQDDLIEHVRLIQENIGDPRQLSYDQITQTLAALNQTAQELKNACKGITSYADMLKTSQSEQLRRMLGQQHQQQNSISESQEYYNANQSQSQSMTYTNDENQEMVSNRHPQYQETSIKNHQNYQDSSQNSICIFPETQTHTGGTSFAATTTKHYTVPQSYINSQREFVDTRQEISLIKLNQRESQNSYFLTDNQGSGEIIQNDDLQRQFYNFQREQSDSQKLNLLNQSIDSMTISNSIADPGQKSYVGTPVITPSAYSGQGATSRQNVQVAQFQYKDSSASIGGTSSLYKAPQSSEPRIIDSYVKTPPTHEVKIDQKLQAKQQMARSYKYGSSVTQRTDTIGSQFQNSFRVVEKDSNPAETASQQYSQRYNVQPNQQTPSQKNSEVLSPVSSNFKRRHGYLINRQNTLTPEEFEQLVQANLISDETVKNGTTDPSHGQFMLSGHQHLKHLQSPPNFIPKTQESYRDGPQDIESHRAAYKTQELNFYNGLKSYRSPYGPTEGSSSLLGVEQTKMNTKNMNTLDLNESKGPYHELDARYLLSTIKTSDYSAGKCGQNTAGLDAFSFRNN